MPLLVSAVVSLAVLLFYLTLSRYSLEQIVSSVLSVPLQAAMTVTTSPSLTKPGT